MEAERPRLDVERLLAHAPFVRRLAAALLHDANDVDDVVQQTWLATLRRPPREAGALREWLGRVVRSIVRERRRGDERRVRREAAAAPSEAVGGDDPAAIVARLALMKQLADAVLSLDAEQRAAVMARYFDDLPPRTIAQRSGLPLTTIEARLRRAREQLRRRLDPGDDTLRGVLVGALARSAAPAEGGLAIATGAAAAAGLAAGATLMGTKGALAGVALVAGITCAAWFAWDGARATIAPTDGRMRSTESATASWPAASGDATPTETGPERTRLDAAAAASAGASGDAALVGETRRVRVLDGTTRTPVEGARVLVDAPPAESRDWLRDRFTELRHDPWQFAEVDLRSDRTRELDARLAAASPRFVTDAAGETFVPFRAGMRLIARKGERRAVRFPIEADEGDPIVLELEAEAGLRIEVVDEAGQPVADVPVALLLSWSERTGEFWRGTTRAPDGIAEVPVGPVESIRADEGRTGQRIDLFATLGFAPLDGPRVAIPRDLPPRAPLRLVLPATGRVRVEPQDEAGRPLADAAWVGVATARADPFLWEGSADLAWRVARGGAVVYDHVGLGLDLVVYLQPQDGERQTHVVRCRGPERAGETVAIPIAVGPRLPVLTGRIVDRRGDPIAAWRFDAWYRLHQRRNHRSFMTDGAGAFRLPLACDWAEYRAGDLAVSGTPRTVTIAPSYPALLGPAVARSARWSRKLAPTELAPGDHDVGVVVLEGAPLFASGSVVDRAGQPVRGARVEVTRRSEIAGAERWLPALPAVVSGDDGAFLVEGETPAGELRLEARAPGRHFVAAPPVAAGARDVQLVLVENSRLAGRLLLDPGIPVQVVGVRLDEALVVPDPSRKHDPTDVVRVDADGSFTCDALREGRGSLHVAMRDAQAPFQRWELLARIDGLLVPPGEAVTDERLHAIDLRGRIRRIAIRVVDERGVTLTNAAVRYRSEPLAAGDPPFRGAVADAAGVAELFVAGASAELTIAVAGFEPLALSGVAADRDVGLRALPPPPRDRDRQNRQNK